MADYEPIRAGVKIIGEDWFMTMDMTPQLPAGAAVVDDSDSDVTIFVSPTSENPDPDPQAMYGADRIVTGNVIGRMFIDGVDQVEYIVNFTTRLTNGELITEQVYMTAALVRK